MRGRVINVILFLCAFVSVIIFARTFVSFDNNKAAAQTGSNYVVAYLEIPEIVSTGTVVSGQTPLIIRLAGTTAPLISNVSVSLVTATNSIQPVHCINITHDSEFRWRMYCDTLAVANGLYQLRITATAGDQAVVLMTSSGLPAEFGPIRVQNQFTFTQPGSSIIAGTVPISATISGDVMSAQIHIAQSGTGEVLELQKTSGEPMRSSVWQRQVNTNDYPNGTYAIALTYQALNGEYRQRVITQTVTIQNQTSCIPTWSCGDWTECSTTGTRTRLCTDGCGIQVTESEPCSTNGSGDDSENSTTPAPLSVSIVQPQSQASVSELVALRAHVSGNAESVTFFYRRPLSSIEYRIGSGTPSSANELVWTQTWNTRNVPNGSYFIIARASNSTTQNALSAPIGVAVVNTIAASDNTDDTTPSPPTNDSYSTPDTDGDGADDATELSLGTDATTPDTANSSDSIIRQVFSSTPRESRAALDQLVASGRLSAEQAEQLRARLDQTIFEQPTISSAAVSESLKVHAITSVAPESNRSQFVITGIGPAQSYVTLYIYSNPIVVTTKTDDQGNFEYTLDSDLLDGKHEVYVTVNDETGKILEKSTPLTFFVRSAQAITEEEYLRGDVDVTTSSSQQIEQYVRIVAIVILSLIAALGIGWLLRKKSKLPNQ